MLMWVFATVGAFHIRVVVAVAVVFEVMMTVPETMHATVPSNQFRQHDKFHPVFHSASRRMSRSRVLQTPGRITS